jgi:hypothetical protein
LGQLVMDNISWLFNSCKKSAGFFQSSPHMGVGAGKG